MPLRRPDDGRIDRIPRCRAGVRAAAAAVQVGARWWCSGWWWAGCVGVVPLDAVDSDGRERSRMDGMVCSAGGILVSG